MDKKKVNEIIVGAGREPYILGSAFSLKKGKVSDLIKGENGVYKIELVEKRIIEIKADLPSHMARTWKTFQWDLDENPNDPFIDEGL